MSLRDRAKRVLRMCGQALTSSVHDRLDKLEKSPETDAALLQASIHIVENLHALAGRTIVEIEPSHVSPEAALTAFLYSHVPARAAVEARSGAARAMEADGSDREKTEALLRAGYDVYSLEARKSGKPIRARMSSGMSRVFGASAASGGSGVSGISSTAIDTSVGGATGAIGLDRPKEIGLLTLGCDPLPVVRELGDRRACVITAEVQHDFEELVAELRGREYYWHIVLYRKGDGVPVAGTGRNVAQDGNPSTDHDDRIEDPRTNGPVDQNHTSYYANYPRALPNSRGSVFFFRDYRVFAEAQAWCAATLPRTYFKPRQA